ncbi:hypothetical protein YYE_01041 [Plasmodium vinckei vinckei]|nr:hypothetical protein YYE_01041 [Plasmodium vinckei vinckei]
MAGQSEKKRLKKASNFIVYAYPFFSIFSNIHYGITNGLNFTYYTDVLILSFVINIGLFFSFKFFYIYIIIPIYATFKFINFIVKFFLGSPMSAIAPPENAEQSDKKKQKIVYKKVY